MNQSQAGRSGQRQPNAKGCVLVVDDEDVLRKAFVRTLERAGFQVREAADGAMALNELERGTFDLILTDITMPGMNGMELLRRIRARDLDVPVILVTGNPTVDTAAQAVECGALRYLVKPVEGSDLLAAVERGVTLRRIARLKRESAELFGSGDMMVDDRAGLEASFGRGLETLWVAYQPIVDFKTRTVVAYEALVRTREPTLPHPGALFSAAERLGRVHELGRVIRASVAQTLAARSEGTDIFVNLHSSDLEDELLFSASAPLAAFASRVVLEITERVSLNHIVDVPARIRRLQDLGYRIAIDDLGAGYAGLSYFALLSPNVVKLDITLIRGVHEHPIKRKLVGSLTSLCKDLGMMVVAEGIETAQERDTVLELGGDLLQGFLFARPGEPFPKVEW